MNILRYVIAMTIVSFCVKFSPFATRTYQHIADFKIILCDISVKILLIKDVHDRVFLVVEEKNVQCVYNH